MKKQIFFYGLLFLMFWACSKNSSQDSLQEQPKQLRSWDEVTKLAQSFHVDSLDAQKNTALLFMPESFLKEHFAREKVARAVLKERRLFREKVPSIRSFDDYLRLLNSFPNMKEQRVQAKGGQGAFDKWVEEERKIKYHIYCDEKGVIGWVRAEMDDGNFPGRRIDNSGR